MAFYQCPKLGVRGYLGVYGAYQIGEMEDVRSESMSASLKDERGGKRIRIKMLFHADVAQYCTVAEIIQQ